MSQRVGANGSRECAADDRLREIRGGVAFVAGFRCAHPGYNPAGRTRAPIRGGNIF
jgi:hypothetical protein